MAKLSMSKMVEALYDKFIKNAGAPAMGIPGKPSGGQINTDTVENITKPEVWNLYPEPGTEDKYPPITCPPGYHILYDWNNYQVKLNKDCGPL